MSAQHTPGPWQVFCAVSEAGQPYGATRRIKHRLYTCEQLKNAEGKPARFKSEAAAHAAIAKATKSASPE